MSEPKRRTSVDAAQDAIVKVTEAISILEPLTQLPFGKYPGYPTWPNVVVSHLESALKVLRAMRDGAWDDGTLPRCAPGESSNK